MISALHSHVIRLVAVLGLLATGSLLGVGQAGAHVTAQPGELAQGGYGVITMRVPNESDTAATTRVEVTIPADTPLSSVRTTPVDGWRVETVKAPPAVPSESHGHAVHEVVTTLTWIAEPGAAVRPGEYRDFPFSAGPMPEVQRLVLPTVQTYDDGTVVRWDQYPDQGVDLERPAPVVALTGPGDGGRGPDDGRTLSIVALVLGALGALAGTAALVRSVAAGRR